MDSEPDVLLYSPVLVRMNSTSSSSSSSDNVEVEDATNRWIFNWGEFFSCRNISEWNMICLFLVVNFLFVASHHLLVNLYGPQNVWLGPNSSVLAETSSISVKSIKVKELEYSTSGLQLEIGGVTNKSTTHLQYCLLNNQIYFQADLVFTIMVSYSSGDVKKRYTNTKVSHGDS